MTDLLLSLFSAGLLIAFIFCFRTVTINYKAAVDFAETKKNAEQLMAARFIRNAIQQYELRHTRPDSLTAQMFEKTADEMDDLVEEYYLRLSKQDDKVHGLKASFFKKLSP